MKNGGQIAIRGYLVQTLIALLESLDGENPWESVTLEPNIQSDKVDILWKYADGSKAVQVKSSQNPFSKSDVERWAGELESWREADEYTLVLVGLPSSRAVANIGRVSAVSVPQPKNLDLNAFKEQAAHRLERLLRSEGLDPGDYRRREMLAEALTGRLAELSTTGTALTRSDFIKLLKEWIHPPVQHHDACGLSSHTVRLIRVFVSSPGDVKEERRALDDVVERINRTSGREKEVRLELWKWETDCVPQIGPTAQEVIDQQRPQYDIYLGIMKHRFGTPNGGYGSGTEKEFNDALALWGDIGSPWILLYFGKESVDPDTLDLEQYAKVRQFRESLRNKGLYAHYEGVRGSNEAFFEKVDEHLRIVIGRIPDVVQKPEKKQYEFDPKGLCEGSEKQDVGPPIVPPEYIDWLLDQCSELELMGLEIKDGAGVLLDHIYTPLVTSARPKDEAKLTTKRRAKSQMQLFLEHIEKPQLMLDLFNKGSLYVSGDPGSGKSTFCRWVVWLMCKGALPAMDEEIMPPEPYREKFPGQLNGKLPVLVRLRDFWNHLPVPPNGRGLGLDDLEKALINWLGALKPQGLEWDCLKAHLVRGTAVVMIDGVDEVPSVHKTGGHEWYPREALLNVLVEAVKRWTKTDNRVLITSRLYGLDGSQQKRLGLEHAPIQAMDRDLQALLVRRWFVVLKRGCDAGLREAGAMLDHLHGERALDELAANPLLLTAMCIIYNEGKRLPEDKFELYDRIVNTVLHKRYPAVKEKVSQIRGRLAAIAHGMHTGEGLGQERESYEASASDRELDLLLQAYQQLDGATDKGLRDTVHAREDLFSQSGLLVATGDGRAEFYHLSFQEFLAAERLFNLKGMERAGLVDLMLRRGTIQGWRNTLSFLFGGVVSKFNPHMGVELLQSIVRNQEMFRMDPSEWAPEGSCWRLVIVLGDCLEILAGRDAEPPDNLGELFRKCAIQAISREIEVKDRQTLAVTLGRLGDPRIVEDLRVLGHPDEHAGYVKIPAGRYFYGEEKEPFEIVLPFWLSRYPVTNSQYKVFIKDGGYEKKDLFWSEVGRDWLKEEGAIEPRLWRDSRFCGPNQPVVGVSYWEAEAFAKWAGGSLPTERQWEAAARGPEGTIYPWGDKWEDGICNSEEAGLGTTSAVGMFPQSRSKPFGLEDMAGNVFEWCSDYYDEEASRRVIRGGSWISGARYCRAAYRHGVRPSFRYRDLGFRVAPVPPSPRARSSKSK